MKKRKLIYPVTMEKAMEDFLNKIHDVKDMSGNRVRCIVVNHSEPTFCVYAADIGKPTMRIGYSLENLWRKTPHYFVNNFRSRCTISHGFADITLCLLHELGHLSSQQEFKGYDRVREMGKIEMQLWLKEITLDQANETYFQLPDENAATEWAIEWLASAANRKIAKAFEKRFFACFA
jgi:hypothetical protein